MAMFLSKDEYKHIIDLLDGKISRSDLSKELVDWAKTELDINVTDYICDTMRDGLTRLKIVVWDNESRKKFMEGANYNKKIQAQFQRKFSSLAVKYQMYSTYQNGAEFFVCCETVADEIRTEILKEARPEILSLAGKDIWKIEIIFDAIHFFYETDLQLGEHEKDGQSEKLKKDCYGIVGKYDRINAFHDGVTCVFTSKQTLDGKYNGSMFYYTR